MDQVALVDSQINDARNIVDALNRGGVTVTAACWIQDDEYGEWKLYIASRDVEEKGHSETFDRFHATYHAMRDLRWVESSDIRLIGADDPITRDILEAQQRYPTRNTPRYHGTHLGKLGIKQAYILEPSPAS